MPISGPAIALIEVESIARGMIVADAVLKRAPVTIDLAEAVTPGKYLLLFHGGVAEVEESFRAAVESAGSALVDKLFLPQAADALLRALGGKNDDAWTESLGVVEAHTAAATLLCADTALKRAEVRLMRLHLARGIGGKGYFTLTGELDMVQAALESAASAVEPHLLVTTEILERPHPELRGRVF